MKVTITAARPLDLRVEGQGVKRLTPDKPHEMEVDKHGLASLREISCIEVKVHAAKAMKTAVSKKTAADTGGE